MERLEEIKKKLRDYNAEVVASRGCCDTQDFSLDVAFLVVEYERLLSLIDQYKEVLRKISVPMPGSRDNELVLYYERIAKEALEGVAPTE